MQSNADTLVDELLFILGEYLSGINARSLLVRSTNTRAGRQVMLDPAGLSGVLARVEAGALLFTPPHRRQELQSRLASFRDRHAVKQAQSEFIPIAAEADIVVARTRAREVCTAMGARSVVAHKVATVVSELARNIVSYTPGGSIELEGHDAMAAVTVRARDTGRGIPNLDDVMSGKYRSRTGLGLGIVGSRRLSESFEIETGPTGTSIVAKIKF